jgi:hypothetical protein
MCQGMGKIPIAAHAAAAVSEILFADRSSEVEPDMCANNTSWRLATKNMKVTHPP